MCFRKRDAQPDAFMRAFDQAGHIRDHKRAARARACIRIGGNHAQMRLERREWIGRNLGTRRRDARDQSGFPGVRETDQTDIREQF